MKEYFISGHSNSCDINLHTWNQRLCNNETNLLFIGDDFCLISCNSCISRTNGTGKQYFFENIIEKIHGKSKTFLSYKVYRERITEDLKNYRLRDIALKNYTWQTNYFYEDNIHRQYAIITKANYVFKICSWPLLQHKYESAKKYLEDHHFENSYKETLDTLFHYNLFYSNDYEIVRSTEHLINQIKKYIKNAN